jgi:hypothetical protein
LIKKKDIRREVRVEERKYEQGRRKRRGFRFSTFQPSKKLIWHIQKNSRGKKL